MFGILFLRFHSCLFIFSIPRKQLFEDFKRLENTGVKFACDCGKKKFEEGLKSLNKEELKQILEEDHEIEVVCNFCSEKYLFDEEEIKNIIEEE